MPQLSGCEGVPAVFFTAPGWSDVLNAGDKEKAAGSIWPRTRHVGNGVVSGSIEGQTPESRSCSGDDNSRG